MLKNVKCDAKSGTKTTPNLEGGELETAGTRAMSLDNPVIQWACPMTFTRRRHPGLYDGVRAKKRANFRSLFS